MAARRIRTAIKEDADCHCGQGRPPALDDDLFSVGSCLAKHRAIRSGGSARSLERYLHHCGFLHTRRSWLAVAHGEGKTKAEHKRLTPEEGVEALLAPDPKAHCHVNSLSVASGRYAQTLTCPQKRGAPVQISRVGTYDANGFVGRATVTGETPKGGLTIALDQRAFRVGA